MLLYSNFSKCVNCQDGSHNSLADFEPINTGGNVSNEDESTQINSIHLNCVLIENNSLQ